MISSLVVKVGSSVIVREGGQLDYSRIAAICHDVSLAKRLFASRVTLITSGAVAAGQVASATGAPLLSRASSTRVLSAVGQPRLLSFYSAIFLQYGLHVAQFLVTRSDFGNRQSYLALRDGLNETLAAGVVPVLNANDPLQATSSKFSDNDQLAGFVGGMLEADEVIFLSSVQGLYEHFPPRSGEAPIPVISGDFSRARLLARETVSAAGTGGMASKLNAVKLLYDLGIRATIASGFGDSPIIDVLSGASSSTRTSPESGRSVRGIRRWLCTGAMPQGTLSVSLRGGEILKRKGSRGSLLAKGLVGVSGSFERGDVVRVFDENDHLLGYGVVRISSEDIQKMESRDNTVVVHADYFYGTEAWV